MITITDQIFMIEDFKRVILLSHECIIIHIKKQIVEIKGSSLLIDYYSHTEIRGHGNIKQVRFELCRSM